MANSVGHSGSVKRSPGKLQFKLFVNFLVIVIIFVIATSAFYFRSTTSLLIDREEKDLDSLCDTVITNVTLQLKEMDQLSSAINYFSRRNSLTAEDLSEGALYNSLTEYITLSNAPRTKADQINIYSNTGTLTQLGSIARVTQYDTADLDWLKETFELNGRKLISTPYLTRRYSPGSQTRDWFISMYRSAFSIGGNSIGAIETVIRCKNLFSKIASYLRKNPDVVEFYIYNSNGELIYPYDAEEPHADHFKLITSISGDHVIAPERIQDPETGEWCRYALEYNSYTGWYFLVLKAERLILAPVYALIRTILLITCGIAAFAAVLSWYLSRRIVVPVKHLKHIIHRLRLDTLGAESVSDYTVFYEELQELYTEFETMNDSLRRSLAELEQSRDLELRSRVLALQTQMNPHFYYNTLSCISILAEEGRTDEVSQLCRTLSVIMRYISDHSSNVLTVDEELNYIDQYLYCMRIRYQDSLSCEINVSDSIRAYRIPKLLIQPLVENAIKYGTDCTPPWHISVIGFEVDDSWFITVTDSGNGFAPDVLKDLREKLARADANDLSSEGSLSIGGMGMINTFIRWKLFAGNNAIFELGNTQQGHAFVRVGCRKEKS